ncbi:hypothetical protein M8C21_029337 [Ambrosia artemisiifolia]|uniref:Uncharacterized protein n=1 Tax=Ambrosia artemisiifolia TaxID=4212 RepID=A0AAD5CES4_AMBAR|nr:hypothetical protein M8C21_029337 [Ambrosia artemisiifolia]
MLHNIAYFNFPRDFLLVGLHKFPEIIYIKLALGRYQSSSPVIDVPKGHFSVYVEDEFGYAHPMGCLTFPCKEETFHDLTENIQLT